MNNLQRLMITAYSGTHFLVDFASAFFMFYFIAGTKDAYLCVLIYNFCAFAMQMPLGIVADRWNKNFLFAVTGCIMICVAYVLNVIPVAAVIVIGIGNAMFHLGGGIDVLNVSEKKLGALGVFVSPGAFGVYLGTMLGRGGSFDVVFFLFALIAAAGLIFATHTMQRGSYPKNAPFSLESVLSRESAFSPESDYSRGALKQGIITIILCLFLVVCLRSFVGLSLDFSWKTEGSWAFVFILAVVLGKTLGGFTANRFGLIKTTIISLCPAAVLFLFPLFPPAGVAAVLLFNMTMPITLWAMAKIFPGAKGFAFGLLTFGLFLGFLPGYLGAGIPQNLFWLFSLLTLGSLALLLAGLRKARLC